MTKHITLSLAVAAVTLPIAASAADERSLQRRHPVEH